MNKTASKKVFYILEWYCKTAILKNCSFEIEFENKKNPILYPISFLTEESVQIPKFTWRMSYPLFKEPCEMLWIFKP